MLFDRLKSCRILASNNSTCQYLGIGEFIIKIHIPLEIAINQKIIIINSIETVVTLLGNQVLTATYFNFFFVLK